MYEWQCRIYLKDLRCSCGDCRNGRLWSSRQISLEMAQNRFRDCFIMLREYEVLQHCHLDGAILFGNWMWAQTEDAALKRGFTLSPPMVPSAYCTAVLLGTVSHCMSIRLTIFAPDTIFQTVKYFAFVDVTIYFQASSDEFCGIGQAKRIIICVDSVLLLDIVSLSN